MSIIHSIVTGERVPDSWTRQKSLTVEAVKTAVIPWSQSKPMEISEPSQPGKMSMRRAVSGSWGRLSNALWVDVVVLPSGSITRIDLSESLMSVSAEASLKDMKWPVVPVSALAVLVVIEWEIHAFT